MCHLNRYNVFFPCDEKFYTEPLPLHCIEKKYIYKTKEYFLYKLYKPRENLACNLSLLFVFQLVQIK